MAPQKKFYYRQGAKNIILTTKGYVSDKDSLTTTLPASIYLNGIALTYLTTIFHATLYLSLIFSGLYRDDMEAADVKSQLDKIDELERDHLKLTATQTLAEVKKFIYMHFSFCQRSTTFPFTWHKLHVLIHIQD